MHTGRFQLTSYHYSETYLLTSGDWLPALIFSYKTKSI